MRYEKGKAMSAENVRWDAVVDSSRFWTEPSPAAESPPPAAGAGPVEVKIWLYGSLARASDKRPLELEFPQGFSLGDVFAELHRRYGEEFSERIMRADGCKHSHCRVYVDGLRVDDMKSPAHAGPSPALVEIILLAAIEGG